ncbi:putative nuclease of putative toxin-antitoxin system [Sphingobium boeckii]|uniref:Putative nuclease of putative toxin-antitoxin system n=2 Tax=Sphingobium boeckii TaxID=1082345 RepID=A0A7W9AID6_9SPHN|nr:putative nuclease of putative toxin-antitoxin system [Sphingobium boeckii]
MHVNWVRLDGQRDQIVAVYAVADDYIMVTNNGADFRPIYRTLDVHPGLIVILPSVRKKDQLRLFSMILRNLAGKVDLINKLLEIDLDGAIRITDLPPHQANMP